MTNEDWDGQSCKYGEYSFGKEPRPSHVKYLRGKLDNALRPQFGLCHNDKTGIDAHLNSRSLKKISSDKAIDKSKANGFTLVEHFTASKKIVSGNSCLIFNQINGADILHGMHIFSKLFKHLCPSPKKVVHKSGTWLFSINYFSTIGMRINTVGGILLMTDKHKGAVHQLPFSLLHRKSRRYIYVKFRLDSGAWSPAVSTGCETDAEAMEVAFRWAREGIPSVRRKVKISIDIMSAISSLSTSDEAQWICDELSKRGFLRAYVLANNEDGRPVSDFLLEFWDYDKSPYIKERQRKERGVHKTYCTQMTRLVRKWWLPHFKDKVLGCVTHNDIDSCADTMRQAGLIPSSCNIAMSAVTIPLKWAYKKGMIKEDPTLGVTRFANKSKERHILTPDVVTKLFSVEWTHDAYRLANLVASLTGMRCGEVQALRLCDILDGALQVSRSWSNIDGFKCPKNGKSRIVELPFPSVLEALRKRASSNPQDTTPQALVFWSEYAPASPISEKALLDALRSALIKTGMSKDEARQYVFHSWRHFFATYMRGRIDDKLLMTQTGHSTGAMLIRYSAHEAVGDRERIRRAEVEAFKALLPDIK